MTVGAVRNSTEVECPECRDKQTIPAGSKWFTCSGCLTFVDLISCPETGSQIRVVGRIAEGSPAGLFECPSCGKRHTAGAARRLQRADGKSNTRRRGASRLPGNSDHTSGRRWTVGVFVVCALVAIGAVSSGGDKKHDSGAWQAWNRCAETFRNDVTVLSGITGEDPGDVHRGIITQCGSEP